MTEPSPRPGRPPGQRPPVQYKGGDLDPERGPGLGCFWVQLALLLVLVVLTPLSVSLGWSSAVSAGLLFATIGLLLVSGQTIIFLLRLVAADRSEGRRRPMASRTPTVGQIEDEAIGPTAVAVDSGEPTAGPDEPAPDEPAPDEPAPGATTPDEPAPGATTPDEPAPHDSATGGS